MDFIAGPNMREMFFYLVVMVILFSLLVLAILAPVLGELLKGE